MPFDEPRPCVKCDTRRTYAKIFDIHIFGEDCPYICFAYDNWKQRRDAYAEGDKKQKPKRRRKHETV